ncbi:MAG: aconitate hydratase [Chlamydiae bacterium]|nr:aconitate hydratase [Chlamydiota bacterium]
MSSLRNTLGTLKILDGSYYYSLPELEKQSGINLSRLPISLRIVLESLLRNCDEEKIKTEDILSLAQWKDRGKAGGEVPFVVSRVLLQDFTGVPLLVDLAAMRDAVSKQGFSPSIIEPQVPVDLVIDHSVQVDKSGTADAYEFNLNLEFKRNIERYEFLKWGQEAFKTFKVIPPGIGIVHQVNLEHLAKVIAEDTIEGKTLLFPDTLVGTDSHTTMINGLGIVGWGVGGIEAEAAMLGQPVALQMPEVIGFHLSGRMPKGATATDLALRVTEILRKEHVVDKFIEFFGEGTSSLTVADRATIANMAPEYGATMGFFPIDDKTINYLRMTGREENKIRQIQNYLETQDLFGVRKQGELDFTKVVELDLHTVTACVAGPKRPQDRINLPQIRSQFHNLLKQPIANGGYGKEKEQTAPMIKVQMHGGFTHLMHEKTGGLESNPPGAPTDIVEMVGNRPYTTPTASPGYSDAPSKESVLTHGSIAIAAITSCTNTSNPAVMLAAGLLAKKAVEKGLQVDPSIKTSLAPGSRIVTEYLEKAGLQTYLDKLGFQLVGYGCTTCIGNSGPLDETIEQAIKQNDLVVASVLSGNRNFEARIHSTIKANFLMSPPLVVAFALAGKVDINMEEEPIGYSKDKQPVFLKDIWPTSAEIEQLILQNIEPAMFIHRYANVLNDNPLWKAIGGKGQERYDWNPVSTYIQQPPYFTNFTRNLPKTSQLSHMRCLALLGDSVTTDHISPAGSFSKDSSAGKYLLGQGVLEDSFNSYGSRRGNHEVMMRGTFANIRIKNQLAEGKEGGYTKLMPDGPILPIFEACQEYHRRNTPLIVFAGKDYGMGSSRDWAAKGTALLGVKAVVAESFERIHRSNLIGMGILPLEFLDGASYQALKLNGKETYALKGLDLTPNGKKEVILEIEDKGATRTATLKLRLDTPIEVEYYVNGGIMPYVLRQILQKEEKQR